MKATDKKLTSCFVFGVLFFLTATAGAQITGPSAPIQPGLGFIEQYEQLRDIWFFAIFPATNDLFWKLATLEIAFSFVLWMAAQHHFDTLAQHLFRKIFFIGAAYAFLLNADTWLPAIVNSFIAVGKEVSGVKLSPSFVFSQGLGLAVQMLEALGVRAFITNTIGAIVTVFSALLVVLSYGLIAIELAVTLVESYVVMGAGIFLLAFVPFRGTAAISERYLSFVIAIGIKLFMISIIVGAGTLLAPGWGAYVSATTIFDLNVPLTIAFSALLFFLLSTRIPSLAASLALGTVGLTLHDVLGATGSAIRVAATVAAAGPVAVGTVGVARAASQAAGGGAIGALKGMSAGVGALSREALAASVPRLQQAGSHLQQQAREARARQRGGQQEDFIR